MEVLFSYECRCGEPFLLCVSPAGPDGERWRRDAGRVARRLGRGYVDAASSEAFRCPACGTLHERSQDRRAAA